MTNEVKLVQNTGNEICYESTFHLKAKTPNDFKCLLDFLKTYVLIGKAQITTTSRYLGKMMIVYGKLGSMQRAPFHLADDLVWNI